MKGRYQWFSARELVHLRRLVYEAYDLRETGYVFDASAAIVDWLERTRPDREARLVDAAELALSVREARCR